MTRKEKMMKKITCLFMATLMLLMMLATGAFAEATPDRDAQVNQLIDIYKNANAKIKWEPEVPESDNPVYVNTLPEDGDITAEQALHVAIDTILTLTDKTIDDLATYDVRFTFTKETTEGGRSFWTVWFYWPTTVKEATYNYYVSVSSPDAQVIKFEIPPLT